MTSSKARRASSCEGGATGEEMALVLGEEEPVAGWGGGAMSVGLLLGFGALARLLPVCEAWRRAGLNVRAGSDSSSTGVCRTGEATICWRFMGVVASPASLLVAKVCSRPSMGKVWLRGRMLLALAADEIVLDCWADR